MAFGTAQILRGHWLTPWGLAVVAVVCLPASGVCGPFSPAAGKPGSDAVSADDPRLRGWAVETTALVRGPEEIDDPFSLLASYGSAGSALGRADVLGQQDQPEPGSQLPKPAVSLGDGGSITVRFDPPIADGPGPDLAVFENGISFNGGASFFMELAFVEVSSDGLTFFRFPALSETPASPQIAAYGAVDPTEVHNLAGKYMAGFGTPFDLADLPVTPALNRQAVTHVRILDVVGCVDPRHARLDSLSRVINDPWPTFLTTSGFDLDAVGALHLAESSYEAWRAGVTWGLSASDALSDPDGDGVPNLLEYAFDLPPLYPQPAPSARVLREPDGWVAHPPAFRPAADLAVEAEISTDLRTWSPRPASGPTSLGPVEGPPAYYRLTIRLLTPP
jgi:hypothetical protein